MQHRRVTAIACVALMALTTAGYASPLDWPEAPPDLARHCAAVLSAFAHAYEFAATLSGAPAPEIGALPQQLVDSAGGPPRLTDIAAAAERFAPHAESVARTSFYPRLIGDGTPYLADDGRDLVLAVQTCRDHYGL